MSIRGIGKYTFVSASLDVLDFEDMMVGSSGTEKEPTERTFVLHNPSVVRASFQVHQNIITF